MPAKRQPDPPPFTGPDDTIFVYERPTGSWLISAWDGTEVRVPTRDLARFVEAYRSYLEASDDGRAE